MALERLISVVAVTFMLQNVPYKVFARHEESRGCHRPSDVVFVLDASASIWGPNFRKQLRFVNTVIDDLDIDPSVIRCGLLTFGDTVRVEFGLRTYTNIQNMKTEVSRVSQLRGNTRTDLALRRMRQMMAEDGRSGVPRIGIVLTDGESDRPNATRQEAEVAHRDGITLFAVGIGTHVHHGELRHIASESRFVFNVDNYDGLERIRELLMTRACHVRPPADDAVQNIQGCSSMPADILFIIDGSGTIRSSDFRRQLNFVNDTVSHYHISEAAVHIGVMTFADTPESQFDLDDYSSVEAIQSAVERIAQQRGGTNVSLALQHARLNSFARRRNRASVPKIAVVVTDGWLDNAEIVAREAALLRDTGVTVFGIGVGSAVGKRDLESIASTPSDVYSIGNYTALGTITTNLISKMCNTHHATITTISSRTMATTTKMNETLNETLMMITATTTVDSTPINDSTTTFITNTTKDTAPLTTNEATTTTMITTTTMNQTSDDTLTMMTTSTTTMDSTPIASTIDQATTTLITNTTMDTGPLTTNEETTMITTTTTMDQTMTTTNETTTPNTTTTNVETTTKIDTAALTANEATTTMITTTTMDPTLIITNETATPNTTTTNAETTTKTQCNSTRPADIMFALPSTIDDTETNQGLRFISSVTQKLNTGNSDTHFGLAPRLCHAMSGFSLDQGARIEQVSRYLSEQRPRGRIEETTAILRFIGDISFAPQYATPSNRTNVVRVVVIVIDRRSSRLTQAAVREASRLRQQRGVILMAVAVGRQATTPSMELDLLGGCESCLMNVETYSDLNGIVDALSSSILEHSCLN